MAFDKQGRGSQPIKPGDPEYQWHMRLEAKAKAALGIHPPGPTFKTLAQRQLLEMARSLDEGDWGRCGEAVKGLLRLVEFAQDHPGW